ncbi:MAG: ATP-binding cassette domain-containing protein, partial [Clostridia bacterium]|nr:ATP-binding cassette domain-containing protein [Deltaproteobacteria bacterium]
MLKVHDLDVHYGAVQALHGVALEVNAGEIVTLIGANGAGKSTVLRALSGLVKPTKGSITFEGQSVAGVKPHVLVRRGIAHAPEGRGIFSNLTVDENLSLGAYTRHDSAIKDEREKALNLFPRLRERLTQDAGTMSGGEQQMLAIARALQARP